MEKNNEIIKLDVEMLEPFNDEDMLVIRGGGVKEALLAIWDWLTGGSDNCPTNNSCSNTNCPCNK